MSQDDAQVPSEQKLEELRKRMDVIRQGAAADVEANWKTPYRNPEVFETKVQARLASHKEYRDLQNQVRQGEAALAAGKKNATGD